MKNTVRKQYRMKEAENNIRVSDPYMDLKGQTLKRSFPDISKTVHNFLTGVLYK